MRLGHWATFCYPFLRCSIAFMASSKLFALCKIARISSRSALSDAATNSFSSPIFMPLSPFTFSTSRDGFAVWLIAARRRHHAPDSVPFGPDRISMQVNIQSGGPTCARLPQASGAQRAGRFAMPVPCAPSAAPPGHAHCVTHTRLLQGAQGAIILLRPRPHKP